MGFGERLRPAGCGRRLAAHSGCRRDADICTRDACVPRNRPEVFKDKCRKGRSENRARLVGVSHNVHLFFRFNPLNCSHESHFGDSRFSPRCAVCALRYSSERWPRLAHRAPGSRHDHRSWPRHCRRRHRRCLRERFPLAHHQRRTGPCFRVNDFLR